MTALAKTSPYESGELTDSMFLILLTIINPIHGYKIMQKIKDMTDNNIIIGPATMYTTLKKMRAAQWIDEIPSEDGKILYQITNKGRDILINDYRKKQNIVDIAKKELGEEYE